jgi:hypothetical protein
MNRPDVAQDLALVPRGEELADLAPEHGHHLLLRGFRSAIGNNLKVNIYIFPCLTNSGKREISPKTGIPIIFNKSKV